MTAASGADGISARAAKLFYIILLGLSTMLALFLRYNGDQFGINLGAWEVHCSNNTDSVPADGDFAASQTYVYCKGDAAVYRISFVLATFFGMMTLGSLSGNGFHRGFWGPKLVGLFFGLLACFFIPNSFFDNSGYAWLARIVSMGFLCLQILILIDFSYQWNDAWVALAFPDDGSENKKWLVMILASSVLLYLASLVGVPLLFTFYDCDYGVAFSAVTLIGIIIFTILTLFRDKIAGVEGAVLPASVVAAYCTYLCWSALDSNPDLTCKPDSLSGNNTTTMTIGILVGAVSLMWTSLSVTDGLQGLVSGGGVAAGDSEAAAPLYTVEGGAVVDTFESAGDENDWSESHLWVFHLTMMTASMYMSMLLTNWGASDNVHGNEDGKIGTASMWVKIVSQWLTIMLYVWTLVAPRVLADRDFDW